MIKKSEKPCICTLYKTKECVYCGAGSRVRIPDDAPENAMFGKIDKAIKQSVITNDEALKYLSERSKPEKKVRR